MRDIKFRIWINFLKKMKYPTELEELNITLIGLSGKIYQSVDENIIQNTAKPLKVFLPDQVFLMQCTGLKDKNGKEIYEGDIYTYNGHHVDVVEWIKGRNGESGFKLWSNAGVMYQDIEVIGNIHENPELLIAKNI